MHLCPGDFWIALEQLKLIFHDTDKPHGSIALISLHLVQIIRCTTGIGTEASGVLCNLEYGNFSSSRNSFISHSCTMSFPTVMASKRNIQTPYTQEPHKKGKADCEML